MAVPIDAYRKGDAFVVALDHPASIPNSITRGVAGREGRVMLF